MTKQESLMSRFAAFFIGLISITTVAFAGISDEKILAEVLAYHNKHTDCDYKNNELFTDNIMVLNKHSRIIMVLCNTGAYQGSSVFYIADDEQGSLLISPQIFADTSDGKKFSGTDALTSPDFDHDKKSISSFYKSRGLGGCGATSRHIWSDDGFYLAQAGFMPCCSQFDEQRDSLQCKKFLKLREADHEVEFPIIYRYKK